ncbi:MAG: hypothetical protein V2B18_18070, partial [Pseudomonadota bacterium]
MKKGTVLVFLLLLSVALMATVGMAAYHHGGEKDSIRFIAVYPGKAGTKLDRCALCHTGGSYEAKPG